MTNQTPNTDRLFRLTKAKIKALELLSDYYVLRVKDIGLLRGQTDENMRRSTQNTLTSLYREGLVSRLPYFDITMDLPTRTYAYGLTDRTAKEYGGKTFDEHSVRTLDHELEITDFHIALKRLPLKLQWNQANIKKGINPDAYFSLTDPKLPEGKNTMHYFLEIERAKIGNIRNGEPSIVRKLARYYEYYNSDECEKDWGFRTYRVIIVVANSDKQYNLCERLTDYKHRMFWIATEPAFKENIKGQIFRTPKDFSSTAYSFLSH